MTFRTVLNKIFFARGVVQTLSADVACDQESAALSSPKTTQSEIVGLFADELRGRHPIRDAAQTKKPEYHNTPS